MTHKPTEEWASPGGILLWFDYGVK
jgi:hypothetical protein